MQERNYFYQILIIIVADLCPSIGSTNENQNKSLTIHKHSHETSDQSIFIDAIFTKYGNGTVMTYEGFEHLMNGIEIGNIILDDSVSAHRKVNSTEFRTLHTVNHSHVIDTNTDPKNEKRHKRHFSDSPVMQEDTTHSNNLLLKCLNPYELLQIYDVYEEDIITKDTFLHICPAMVFQLEQRRCLKMDVLIRYRTFSPPELTGRKAWIYGFICLLIISVTGLLVVSLVPLLQRISFDGILQFLIALAVGALTGDAMLHLIPHSLTHIEAAHDHSESHEHVYKGLCGLSAMHFFFLIGRIQAITAHNKKKATTKALNKIPECKEKLNTEDIEIVDFEKEYEVRVHHKHGHSHNQVLPTSVSGMIWRIVVGDGIHNFSDGLAIGAAFANSLTGGISTSVAVLCHELPHEMGDFAILLKKGVSVKRAVLFNCLSSLLSCIGLVIGIAAGNIGVVSLWIFIAVAGMFIYISLVDMIPELTLMTEDEDGSWKRLITQIFGLGIGTGIMLMIALYEEQIKNIIS